MGCVIDVELVDELQVVLGFATTILRATLPHQLLLFFPFGLSLVLQMMRLLEGMTTRALRSMRLLVAEGGMEGELVEAVRPF